MTEDELVSMRTKPESELIEIGREIGVEGFAARHILQERQLLAVQKAASESADSARRAAWWAAIAAIVTAIVGMIQLLTRK